MVARRKQANKQKKQAQSGKKPQQPRSQRAPQRQVVVRPTISTNAVRAVVRSELRPPVDQTLRRYVSAVVNPFTGPLSKGVHSTGGHAATAVVRRRAVCTVTLNANEGGVNSGVDIYIPLVTTSDPYVLTATNASTGWTGVSSVLPANFDATASIPAGAQIRVVAAAVRVRPIDPADACGGVFYFYPSLSPAPSGGAAYHGISTAHGSARFSVGECAAIATVQYGKPLTFIGSPGQSYVTAQAPRAVADVISTKTWNVNGNNEVQQQGLRLFYDASMTVPGKFIFEIASIVEYYHDTHRSFSTPSITHGDGETVVAGVVGLLEAPGSGHAVVENHGSHMSMQAKIEKALGIARSVGKGVLGVMETGYHALKGAAQIKGAYNALRAGATAGEMALALV